MSERCQEIPSDIESFAVEAYCMVSPYDTPTDMIALYILACQRDS